MTLAFFYYHHNFVQRCFDAGGFFAGWWQYIYTSVLRTLPFCLSFLLRLLFIIIISLLAESAACRRAGRNRH